MRKGEGKGLTILIAVVLGLLIVVLAARILVSADKTNNAFLAAISKPFAWLFGDKDQIPPELALYYCEDAQGKKICVISEDKMKELCKKVLRKYEFSDETDLINCENRACLANYPELLIKGEVIFLPVNEAWTGTVMIEGIPNTLPDSIYDISIAHYKQPLAQVSLARCPGGSQLKKTVVQETCSIGSDNACYNSGDALSQLRACAAKHSPMANALIIGIDFNSFGIQPGCQQTTHISDTRGNKPAILMNKDASIPPNEWNRMLGETFLNQKCTEVSEHTKLSDQFPQCTLLYGKI